MYKILEATDRDIPLIRELTFKVWPQTYATILTQNQIDYMLEIMYSEESLRKQMAENCRFIIIYDDSDPVGFASYQFIGNDVYKLHKIYVLPSQQGKGTGKFLIDYIIDDIRSKKGSSLQLQVNRNNKAKSFYEKLGFKIIQEADFDIGNGYFMNDYVMEKKL